ncbi:hypothetical protein GO986_03480 [Deinococcus sp. HMF7620]|uniref:Uncharacterized protein n=1 Tax=Deinococcus arboris TaxID=2682977 RepID=A0A7C9M055_9DEIO|nr:hypothetical protein [Deinococcus arboris]MVN85822.1 hypothetical protein [Deinococcus arboris]
MKTRTRSKGKLGLLLTAAPVILELLALARKSGRKSKYTKASKRDRAFDFILNQAQRKLGGKSRRSRWF